MLPNSQPSPIDIMNYYNGVPSPPILPKERVFVVDASDGFAINSVEGAEDYLLRNLPDPCTTFSVADYHDQTNPGTLYCGDNPSISIIINRQANLISARTRVGAGNVVLVSPRAYDHLRTVETNTFTNIQPVMKFGRWQQVGVLNCMDVYLGEHLPVNRIYVVRVDEKPGHAVLIRANGAFYIVIDPASKSSLPTTSRSVDFFNSINLE